MTLQKLGKVALVILATGLVAACAGATVGHWQDWCQTVVLDGVEYYKHAECAIPWIV